MDIVTLVPAFKPQYLPDLLNSFRLQAQRSRKIIFSDDSPQGVYRATLMSEALAPLRRGLNIECIEGPRRGGYANVLHLLEAWSRSSALVHVMFDDDVIYPDFYASHLVAHASAGFSCTVSRRWLATPTGQPLASEPVPAAVTNTVHRLLSLDAEFVFKTTAAKCNNWLGEFSNAVFRAETVAVLEKPMFEGVSYAGLWDLGAFMASSLLAPVGHIHDHLGYFRTGGSGNSAQFFGPYMKAAYIGYAALCLGGRRLGRYDDRQVAKAYGNLAQFLDQRYPSESETAVFGPLLKQLSAGEAVAEPAFVEAWHAFLQRHDFF